MAGNRQERSGGAALNVSVYAELDYPELREVNHSQSHHHLGCGLPWRSDIGLLLALAAQ